MKEEKDENIEPKKIKIVKGDSKDLKISEVRDNLSFEVSEEKAKKDNIIIPKNQNKED